MTSEGGNAPDVADMVGAQYSTHRAPNRKRLSRHLHHRREPFSGQLPNAGEEPPGCGVYANHGSVTGNLQERNIGEPRNGLEAQCEERQEGVNALPGASFRRNGDSVLYCQLEPGCQ